jgi:hypothetical protein
LPPLHDGRAARLFAALILVVSGKVSICFSSRKKIAAIVKKNLDLFSIDIAPHSVLEVRGTLSVASGVNLLESWELTCGSTHKLHCEAISVT